MMLPSDKLSLFDLIDIAQINAIQDAVNPTQESLYRLKCRDYSTIFHTPLHMVHTLDPLFVLKELYSHQYRLGEVDNELEDLLDILYKIQDPTYNRLSKEDTEELVDAALNKELKRLGKKKPENKVDTKNTSEKKKLKVDKPKSGGLNFSDLEKKESLVEGINGFKD